jgi:ABC-type Fe3+/spermidine/putrescine transport system ATPase subunit
MARPVPREGFRRDTAGGEAAREAAERHQPGIRFERVTVAYGQTVALDDFSIEIEPGEVMALLGPSGSGKTTALRAVAGFVTPTRGRIFLGDTDVTSLPPHRRGIGMVVQQYALFPHMRVEDNVAFGLRAGGAPRAGIAVRVSEWRPTRGAIRRSSRAASSNASRSRVRSRYDQRCCFSTSRCRRSTRSCAAAC